MCAETVQGPVTDHLFRSNASPPFLFDPQVRLSVVEIYCERVRDLLYPDQDNLAIKQDASRGVYVEGA